MHQKMQKILFCDVNKVENADKKYFTLSKENLKSPFKDIRLVRLKSPVKGLNIKNDENI
jgi:hypothetical protein